MVSLRFPGGVPVCSRWCPSGVPVPSRGCPEPSRSVPVGPSLILFGALLTAVSQHQCRLIPKRAAIFQRCCEASSQNAKDPKSSGSHQKVNARKPMLYCKLRAPVRTTRQDAPAQKTTRSITPCRTLLYTNKLDSATVNYTKGCIQNNSSCRHRLAVKMHLSIPNVITTAGAQKRQLSMRCTPWAFLLLSCAGV